MTIDLKLLAEPFDESDVEFRAGAATDDRTRAMALAYITARAVMDRLDKTCGPENWRDQYDEGPGGGVLCGMSIKINNEWITKWDGAENTQFEGVKGGLSSSFKRAAVKWGIGRYLYDLPSPWVEAEPVGNKGCKINQDAARAATFGRIRNSNGWKGMSKVDFFTRATKEFGETVEQITSRLRNAGYTEWNPLMTEQFYKALKESYKKEA